MGEEDSYVTAGYNPHKGERRLLPLPTLLIHLIIRPSGWLKAGCMATWHAVTPTLLSDEGFVLCYRTVNFWGNFRKTERKKKKVNLIWVRSPTTAIGILKPDLGRFEGRDEADAICETQAFSALLPSHVQSGCLITFTLMKCFFESRPPPPTGPVCFQNNNTMADLSLQAQGFRKKWHLNPLTLISQINQARDQQEISPRNGLFFLKIRRSVVLWRLGIIYGSPFPPLEEKMTTDEHSRNLMRLKQDVDRWADVFKF